MPDKKTYTSHAEVMARQTQIEAHFSLDGWSESVCLPDLRGDEEKESARKCWWDNCGEPILIGGDFCQFHRAEDFLRMIANAFDPGD